MNLIHRWKHTSLPNQLIVGTGALVAFGTLFYAGAAAVQVCLMRQASKDSAAQVERLSKATDDAIKKAVDTNGESLTKTLKESKASFDSAIAQDQKALQASTRQAKAALDASIEASRNDQRAWLVIANLHFEKEPTAGEPFNLLCTIANTGKTPALRSTIKDQISFGPTEPSPPSWDMIHASSDSVVFPNTTSPDIPYGIDAKHMTKPVIDAYISHVNNLYVRTRIDYADVFGRPHWAEVCNVHSFGDAANKWLACSSGGNVDTP